MAKKSDYTLLIDDVVPQEKSRELVRKIIPVYETVAIIAKSANQIQVENNAIIEKYPWIG